LVCGIALSIAASNFAVSAKIRALFCIEALSNFAQAAALISAWLMVHSGLSYLTVVWHWLALNVVYSILSLLSIP
jgi:hypothetical protein